MRRRQTSRVGKCGPSRPREQHVRRPRGERARCLSNCKCFAVTLIELVFRGRNGGRLYNNMDFYTKKGHKQPLGAGIEKHQTGHTPHLTQLHSVEYRRTPGGLPGLPEWIAESTKNLPYYLLPAVLTQRNSPQPILAKTQCRQTGQHKLYRKLQMLTVIRFQNRRETARQHMFLSAEVRIEKQLDN